jgi:hypothetical protein
MLAQSEREDMLRLLAIVGQGVGAQDLAEQYITPAEGWADKVEELGWTPGQQAAMRQAAVAAFLDAAEG